ncbi:MAG: hypothetical protein JRH20_31655, partial [Deltaproteobacteria bacterium]|nr:hypothetical protein [Deltaproteobacteria bacterium]
MRRGSFVRLSPLFVVSFFFLFACGGVPQNAPPDPTSPPTITPPTPKTGAPPLDPSIFAQVGDTEFLTANSREQLSTGTGDYATGANGRAELDDMAEGKTGDPSAPPTAPPAPEPIPDVTREIVEADI